MRLALISLIVCCLSSCGQKTSELINPNGDELLLFQYSSYKASSSFINKIDTLILERKQLNDSLLSISYRFVNQDSKLNTPIDPVYFTKSLKKNEEFAYFHTSDEMISRRINIQYQTTGDLFEVTAKNPPIDAQGVALFSSEYGLILSYSPSWGNYYFVSWCSDPQILEEIQSVIIRYLMGKNTFLNSISNISNLHANGSNSPH